MKLLLKSIVLLSLWLIIGSPASAFVDQIAVSPPNPSAGRPITISFRAGDCDIATAPLTWVLQGTGRVRDLIVNGLPFQEPLFCGIEVGTIFVPIGNLPTGEYEVHIKIRNPLDGVGGIPSPSYGSVQFTVGASRPIPVLHSFGLFVLSVLLFGAVWLGRRRLSSVAGAFALALACCIVPISESQAQESLFLEVTLTPPPGPTPAAIVEGYDFASGLNPPISALTVGSPTHGQYLLPFRSSGQFAVLLNTHPDSVRAKLERS